MARVQLFLKFAALVLSCLLFSLSISAQTQSLFFTPPAYPACSYQQVAQDFNQDGNLDLVCGGSVLLGNGDGTFRQGTDLTLPPGLLPLVAVSADFNNDGKPDILLAGNSAIVYVYLGNGDGTFQPAVGTDIAVSFNPPIVVADLHGNGKPDLVVTAFNPNALLEFPGHGDGTFGSPIPIPIGSLIPVRTVLGDFNGDGKVDIAFAVSPTGVAVLLGNGDGSFQSPVVTTLSISADHIAAGDFNNDGHLDLLIGSGDGVGPQTLVLLGKGNGSFQPPQVVVPFEGILATADFNGDGRLDFVQGWGVLDLIFLGNGDGTFGEGETVLGGFDLIADFNNDHKPDISTGNSILLGNGDGTFLANPVAIVGGFSLTAGVAGDFNRDGTPDIAATNGLGNTIYILQGDGTGKFSLQHSYTLPLPGYAVATADVNRDGNLDLVLVTVDNVNNWTLNVMLGNGDGSFKSPMTFPQGIQINSFQIAVADFNGDRIPDLAFVSNSELAVYIGHGDGTFASPLSYFAGSAPTSLVTADFNNDGKIDVAVGSNTDFAILLGNGDGTFQSAILSNEPIFVSAAADLNNDGNVDLIADNGSEVLLGKGDGTFDPPLQTGGLFGTVSAVADVNGDGKLDLITQSDIQPTLVVQLGNGDGTFGSPIQLPSPVAVTSFLLAADFNRDGKPDLAANLDASVATFLNISQSGFDISASVLSPPTVKAGGSATSTVTVTPTWGFNGSVGLACSGLPSGANCSFNPGSVGGASGTSKLTLGTSASTPAGTYPIKVTGTASGSQPESTTLSLVIPGFSISGAVLSPSSVSPGGSATSTITVAGAGGFSAAVALSCSSITLNGAVATIAPPACAFSPGTVAGGSGTSMLTVSTTAATALLSPSWIRRSLWLHVVWLPVFGMALLAAGLSSTSKRNLLLCLPMSLMLFGVVILPGCGGGGSRNGGGGDATPPGTYTITVQGATGSTVNNATVTLAVQ
jgi:hypothetical protein